MSRILTRNRIAASLAVIALLLLASLHADAAGRWAFARRGAWSRTTTSYHDGGGNRGHTTTLTRANGQTATRTFNRSVSNGTITDTRSVTTFNGATHSATVTRTPGQGHTTTYTGRNGRTYSAATTHYNDGNGDLGRTTTFTGPNGKTSTRTFNQTGSGGTVTDTHSTSGFNGARRSATVTRTAGQGHTVTYTGRDGRTYTSVASRQGEPQGDQ
jgi:hypothetical protein